MADTERGSFVKESKPGTKQSTRIQSERPSADVASSGVQISAADVEDDNKSVTSSPNALDLGPPGDAPGDDTPARDTWDSKWEFMLSCIGLSVGLGNVWRFPYLAYAHGGAAFLLAYTILQVVVGKPMYLMELSMGQYYGGGPTEVWHMAPFAKGVGISMCFIAFNVAYYYNIIISYAFHYLFTSLRSELPWTECTKKWNQEHNCTDGKSDKNCSNAGGCQSPSDIYFHREVIHKSDGLNNLGTPITDLTLCLLLSWSIVVVSLIRGIKSSGKVVWVTATFPYIILFIMLIRGATMDGAGDGIKHFIVPKWEKLATFDVWFDALGQVFFSLSITFGGIIMFGSYNKFHNHIYHDAVIIACVDMLTSILSGFVVFSFMGALAHKLDVPFEDVAQGGYGLTFIVYPQVMSYLPFPQIWSFLFFAMLVLLGVDSEFALMETVLTGIQDVWPFMRRYKSFLALGFGLFGFIIGLPLACPGGDHLVALMDYYGATMATLFVSTMESATVMWVYGARRFLEDLVYMLGGKKFCGWQWWMFCWYLSPIIIFILFMQTVVNFKPPRYDTDEIPYWAQATGWLLFLFIVCPIPICFIWRLWTAWKSKENIVQYMFKPDELWRPNDGLQKDSLPKDQNDGDVALEDDKGISFPQNFFDIEKNDESATNPATKSSTH